MTLLVCKIGPKPIRINVKGDFIDVEAIVKLCKEATANDRQKLPEVSARGLASTRAEA